MLRTPARLLALRGLGFGFLFLVSLVFHWRVVPPLTKPVPVLVLA